MKNVSGLVFTMLMSQIALFTTANADETKFPYNMSFNLPRISVTNVGVNYELQGPCEGQSGEIRRKEHLTALSTNVEVNSYNNKNGAFRVEIPKIENGDGNDTLVGTAFDLTLGPSKCLPLWPTTKPENSLIKISFSYSEENSGNLLTGLFKAAAKGEDSSKDYSGEIEVDYFTHSKVTCTKTTESAYNHSDTLKLDCKVTSSDSDSSLNYSADFTIE